jgi:hypothetical protein
MARPMRPPAVSNSHTFSGWVEAAAAPRAGACPTVTSIGQCSPRAHHFLRMVSACLPGSMKMLSVFLSRTETR